MEYQYLEVIAQTAQSILIVRRIYKSGEWRAMNTCLVVLVDVLVAIKYVILC